MEKVWRYLMGVVIVLTLSLTGPRVLMGGEHGGKEHGGTMAAHEIKKGFTSKDIEILRKAALYLKVNEKLELSEKVSRIADKVSVFLKNYDLVFEPGILPEGQQE